MKLVEFNKTEWSKGARKIYSLSTWRMGGTRFEPAVRVIKLEFHRYTFEWVFE